VPAHSSRRALQTLNFFMADMQAGVGPFLGVFLLAHGWQRGWIGSVMTMGAITGVVLAAPAGAWVDLRDISDGSWLSQEPRRLWPPP
jgi:hypothetical protein